MNRILFRWRALSRQMNKGNILFLIPILLIVASRMSAAAPPLTTIEDVIYKADGTKFNGVAFIEWKSFQAANNTTIATHSVAVPISNGNLRVRLVPTTNATPSAYYQVRYHSDGRVQFTEFWSVPASTSSVRLSTVRVTNQQVTGSTNGGTTNSRVELVDVVGLEDELNQRPVKGFGFTALRALRTGPTGALESVSGNLSDCVRVDGTSGPCGTSTNTGGGGSNVTFIDNEVPTGSMNGSNTVFSLAQTPSPGFSLMLFRNGVLLRQGLDYQLNANSITILGSNVPKAGDVLTAAYRINNSQPTGNFTGALTGSFPNVQLAADAVSNFNVAPSAAIAESKLALNFPTHTNANDPTATEKAALLGTAGQPSSANRFVTNEDPRMVNSRPAQAHPMLGAQHSDTTPAEPVRGDLIVGQGVSTTWGRLPLGPANRCLVSNGVDAIWNTCLYTGFSTGSIPFVDSQGNLSQNAAQLKWDSATRKLSVGSAAADGTVTIQDGAATVGATTLTVRAGAGQSATDLQRWQSETGTTLTRVESSGAIVAPSVTSTTTSTRAAWRETGASTDPSSASNGDSWYNTTGRSRKSVEGGQTHTHPQVICAAKGSSTSATTATNLGTCSIPAGLLQEGDRLEVRYSYLTTGTAAAWSADVRWGGTTMVSRTNTSAEALLSGRTEIGIWNTSSASIASRIFVSGGAETRNLVEAAEAYASGIVITLRGNLTATGSTTVQLSNFTVIRYPAQTNP